MKVSVAYTDKNGVSRTYTLKESESAEALKNDYYELMRTYDKRYVKIERIRAEYGEALHLRITVYARSHYLTSLFDKRPKVCESMSVEVICYPGYPLKAVTAKYDRNHYLASPNVFKSGIACIDRWKPLKSSLLTVVEKLVMDIIHNPTVTRYDSMANSELSEWHYKGCKSGEFPTVDPALLYARSEDSSGSCLPPRRGDTSGSCLPPRRGDTSGSCLLPRRDDTSGSCLLPRRGDTSGSCLLPRRGDTSGSCLLPHQRTGSQTKKPVLPPMPPRDTVKRRMRTEAEGMSAGQEGQGGASYAEHSSLSAVPLESNSHS